MVLRLDHITLFVFVAALLSSCQNVFAEYSIGWLTIAIDGRGEVTVSAGPQFAIPTLIGTFRAGMYADVDTADVFNVSNTLTIRYNGTDYVYDMRGQSIDVSFGRGYYSGIRIQGDQDNLIINIEQVSGEPAPRMPPTALGCPMEPRLTVGSTAYVYRLPNSNNRVRSSPSLSASQNGILLAGSAFRVIDGPVCADGINWWYIQAGSLSGWTAEGLNSEYYLTPNR